MNTIWEKLSPREQRLAIAVAGMIMAALILMLVLRSVNRIQELDRTVNRLEGDMLNYVEQDARGVSVDKAFAAVAMQHSSAWTEAEIHDRLRQEIQRLAQEDPDSPATGKNLVDIPILRQGVLKDSEQGYREYSLAIQPAPTDVYSIFMFLIRLQSSPQSLRVDGLELSRSPESQLVTATINVTRIIVAGSPTEGDTPLPMKPPIAEWKGDAVEPWLAQGCDLTLQAMESSASDGTAPTEEKVLKAVATAPNATASFPIDAEPGATYELNADIAATGQVSLHIMSAEGKAYDGGKELTGDSAPYHYRIQFTVPKGGVTTKLAAPALVFGETGGKVFLDNVVITKQ